MLNLKNGDILAFPQQIKSEEGSVNPVSGETVAKVTIQYEIFPGMTLRDYFAAAALSTFSVGPNYSHGCDNSTLASRAFNIADAMLKERLK